MPLAIAEGASVTAVTPADRPHEHLVAAVRRAAAEDFRQRSATQARSPITIRPAIGGESAESSTEVALVELSVVVGNPKPRSRTLAIAEAVAQRVAAANDTTVARTIDLCDHARDLFVWPHDGLAALNEKVAASDFLVIASPTYKAAYTGLLKAFLDRHPNNGLAGVTAVPVMTGDSAHHAMVIDSALRPVLVELGASVPSRGLYFVMTQMDALDAVVDAWAEQNVPLIGQAVTR